MIKKLIARFSFDHSAAIFMEFVWIINLLAVIGWLFNQPILASFRSEYIPMAPSTGFVFLGLCIIWLTFKVFQSRNLVGLLIQSGLLILLVIVIILAVRYYTGYGPDLEYLLSPTPPLFGQIMSARMSPLTALSFVLVILALLLLTISRPGSYIKNTASILSLAVFVLNGIYFIGYLFGAPLFYGGTVIPVALTTALSFLFLSSGLLMTAGPSEWPIRVFIGPSLKAHLMRTFIPISILIILIQGFLSSGQDQWNINPAIRVAFAVLVALSIVIVIITLIAKNIDTEIERGNRARLNAEKTLKKSEARFRTLAETANDAIIIIDRKGLVVFWNWAAESIFGYSADEMNSKLLNTIMPDGFRTAHQLGLQRVASTGETHILGTTVEVTGLRKNGLEFPLALSLATWQVDEEMFYTGIAHDISQRKRFELVQNTIFRIAQAAITGERIEVLYQTIHTILGELLPAENLFIALYNSEKELISFPYFVDQYDESPIDPGQIEGLTGYVIRTGRPLLATRETFDRLVKQGKIEEIETPCVEWLGVPLIAQGRIIGVLGVQSYFPDIHFTQKDMEFLEFVSNQIAQTIERKHLEEEIRNLSLMDELTKLYNRRGFTLLAEQELKLAHRMKRAMLLFFADVDNLKTINDTRGHAFGDTALKEVSAILKATFREADILARIGGDEFVVLVLDANTESTETITKRLQVTFEARNQQKDIDYHLTLSLGTAFYDPEDPCTLSELIAQADGQMYIQKQAGNEKK
ncbi:MAG TPA: diguanylate cyclase [Leptolinea sp.]